MHSISENHDDTDALRQVFDELITAIPDLSSKRVYVLSRYTV